MIPTTKQKQHPSGTRGFPEAHKACAMDEQSLQSFKVGLQKQQIKSITRIKTQTTCPKTPKDSDMIKSYEDLYKSQPEPKKRRPLPPTPKKNPKFSSNPTTLRATPHSTLTHSLSFNKPSNTHIDNTTNDKSVREKKISTIYPLKTTQPNKIIEKSFLCVNHETKPVYVSKNMLSMEDSTETRHFLQTAEKSIQNTIENRQPFNYISSPLIFGSAKPQKMIKVTVDVVKYKVSFSCSTKSTGNDLKIMIEKELSRTLQRFNVKFQNHILLIAGTRQYLDDEQELCRYAFIDDLTYRSLKLNLVMIPSNVLTEVQTPNQIRHQTLLLKQKKQCRASVHSDEILSFSIYELLNFDPETVFRKFYDESDIPNCVKSFKETQSFEKQKIMLHVSCVLYMGTKILLDKEYVTASVPNTIFDCRVMTDFTHAMLPLEVRLGITLYATRRGKQQVIGFVNTPLFDFQGFLISNYVNLRLWPDEESDAVSSALQNPSTTATIISLKFPEPAIRIVYQQYSSKYPTVPKNLLPISEDVKLLAVNNDPFIPLSDQQQMEIWQNRYNILTQFPTSLDLLLRAVPWTDARSREEMADLIKIWPGIGVVHVIGLLDARNSFSPARKYAVKLLEDANDSVILGYLPQFIQVLKFESYACSDLAFFLLKKALKNRGVFGQLFYWLLVGENEKTTISLRSRLLLESYCSFCGSQLTELKTQENFIKILEEVVISAKTCGGELVNSQLPKLLDVVNKALTGSQLTLPFISRQTIDKVIVKHCKVFDSNAHPVLLAFQSSPTFPDIETRFIFKVGDNLMQDVLTLQMFRLMDNLWKKNGYDFRLTLYNVIATSKTSGIIEFVPNAETVNHIQTESRGATGVFDDACIYEWLKQHNPKKEDLDAAIENFTYSCAGYCVATYVIGVGDRHNDNIMVSKDGHLFHIDFGYFLGNIIKLGFYSKESAPFVLTNDFMYVITTGNADTDKYKKFEELCCSAFMVLRSNAKTFIYLFMMMLCGGIPQLKRVEDVQYIKDAFQLDKTDEEAEKHFRLLIHQSLNTFRTRLNFFMHSIVH